MTTNTTTRPFELQLLDFAAARRAERRQSFRARVLLSPSGLALETADRIHLESTR